jgi:hypothetical protein
MEKLGARRAIVIAKGFVDQFIICLDSCGTAVNMAASASKVETNLRQSNGTIFAELSDLSSIYSHHMGAEIASEHIGIADSTLGDTWHVTGNTFCNGRVYL